MLYKNKKNQKIYRVINHGRIIDATNATEGREMVLYLNDEDKLFVREINEFKEKFEEIDSD